MKVVYNTCYGGFSISEAAMKRYCEIKRIDFTKKEYGYRDFDRNDPALVQVVEELGPQANGAFASLEIVDVPKGERWRIDEYDGAENVMTVNDYEWEIAT